MIRRLRGTTPESSASEGASPTSTSPRASAGEASAGAVAAMAGRMPIHPQAIATATAPWSRPQRTARSCAGPGRGRMRRGIEGSVLQRLSARPRCYSRRVTSPTLVLYVEDDPNHVMLARRILEREGIAVEAVTDSDQALRALKSTRPDVLVIDLGLPGRGGLALIRTIRGEASLSDLPILAVSASTLRGEVRQALAAGANAFLEKPYTKIELISAISSVPAP